MEDTKVFRGTFSPTVLLISSLCERKVKSKVRPVLVFFVEGLDILWSLPRKKSHIEMSHYGSGEFRQRVTTCRLQ